MIFVYNERQGVRDGQTVMASCLYIYGDRSAHGMRSLFIVYNILYAEMELLSFTMSINHPSTCNKISDSKKIFCYQGAKKVLM